MEELVFLSVATRQLGQEISNWVYMANNIQKNKTIQAKHYYSIGIFLKRDCFSVSGNLIT